MLKALDPINEEEQENQAQDGNGFTSSFIHFDPDDIESVAVRCVFLAALPWCVLQSEYKKDTEQRKYPPLSQFLLGTCACSSAAW